jgi:tripartite ATP-independent transporter DctM subunit
VESILVIALAVIIVIALILAGAPIAFAFGVAVFLPIYILGHPTTYVVPGALKLLESFALLAAPMFIIAGLLMKEGLIAEKLLDFINSLMGWMKGGLGAVTVVTCGVFGAISGTSAPAIAAIGSIVIPRMTAEGYSRGYATGLVACSSLLCLLIPPSVPMIIYALVAKESVAACFLTTIGPALLIIINYCIINHFVCRRNPNIKVIQMSQKQRFAHIRYSFVWALPSLTVPFIILGGIYGGVFTPTEATAIAAVVALLIGFFIYRSLTLKKLGETLVDACATMGTIAIMFFFIFMFSRFLAWERLTDKIVALIFGFTTNKYVILMLLNVTMIIMGMLMDDASGTILSAVVLLPIAEAAGVSALQFAAIVGVNMGLANVTPPTAPLLYMAGRIGGNLPLSEYIGPATLFMIAGSLPVLIITTYIPAVSLFLPHILYGYPLQ